MLSKFTSPLVATAAIPAYHSAKRFVTRIFVGGVRKAGLAGEVGSVTGPQRGKSPLRQQALQCESTCSQECRIWVMRRHAGHLASTVEVPRITDEIAALPKMPVSRHKENKPTMMILHDVLSEAR